jgi:hypothetical protein
MSTDQDNLDENSPFHAINERLGRASLRKDGKGFKKRLTVSVVTGRTNLSDRRSWIFFFRSHFGDLGNLISRILQTRRRKNRKIIVQGDLASFNKLDTIISALFEVTQAGCGAHARRPFWRYRNDDPGLCYFMLRCFLALARLEKKLRETQADPDEIVRQRLRYGRRIWSLIFDRCQQITGEVPRRGDSKHFYNWPPDSDIYKAAHYVTRNYQTLTQYLELPEVFFTNNLCERLLRREKMIITASKFRKNETGRITFDILQTITATCTSAGVHLRTYLPFLWIHRNDLEDNPHLYTPFAFAKLTSRNKQQDQIAN